MDNAGCQVVSGRLARCASEITNRTPARPRAVPGGPPTTSPGDRAHASSIGRCSQRLEAATLSAGKTGAAQNAYGKVLGILALFIMMPSVVLGPFREELSEYVIRALGWLISLTLLLVMTTIAAKQARLTATFVMHLSATVICGLGLGIVVLHAIF